MSVRHWIIWLMLALVPLRGWAVAAMEMPAAVPDGSGVEVASPINAPERTGCHDAAAGHDTDAASHTCGLCDLCHNAVAASSTVETCNPIAPEALPPPGATRDTGRHALGRLDRPPRRSHA
jgi:hypothetical protein